jgi:hypothetical protein
VRVIKSCSGFLLWRMLREGQSGCVGPFGEHPKSLWKGGGGRGGNRTWTTMTEESRDTVQEPDFP